MPNRLLGNLDRATWWAKKRLAAWAAPAWRRKRKATRFIGVTGSCGKTTAKEFIYAVLATRFKGRKNELTLNLNLNVAMSILRVRARDEFLVQEVGIDAPGSIDASLRMLQPQVGVVTVIGLDHYRAFRNREAIAGEKGKLIAGLPADGLAVLNADDPLVLGMRALTRAPCVTYGVSVSADLRAESVQAAWPDRLHFVASYAGQSLPVRTELCGAFWLPSILAGLATGVALGVPLDEAVRAVEKVEPTPGRMYPVVFPDGVTFIRDDWKSPLWTIAPALDFMKTARAQRKIVVLGTLSDYPGGADRKYPAVAREAAEAADLVFFVGPQGRLALKASKTVGEGRIEAFDTPQTMVEHLRTRLQPGDLVLIKGSNRADHLARLTHDRLQPITCWRNDCGLAEICDFCPQLRARQ